MAYTIGASHGPFTGTGSFAIAKPSGIRTIVTGIPFYTAHDGSSPVRYFRLGRFTLGNSHGFQPSHGVEYAQQLVYPIPPVWELLAYDIRNGASCTFYELVDVPDLTLKQPWDRTLQLWSQYATVAPAGGTGNVAAFTYTVPAGRILVIANCILAMTRLAVANPHGTAQCRLIVDGVQVVTLGHPTNVLHDSTRQSLSAGPLYVPAGKVVTVTYDNPDIGGIRLMWFNVSGFLFDA